MPFDGVIRIYTIQVERQTMAGQGNMQALPYAYSVVFKLSVHLLYLLIYMYVQVLRRSVKSKHRNDVEVELLGEGPRYKL